jgi:histidinol-phosphate aminotransferase
MRTIENLVLPHIWNLKPYTTARDEFRGEGMVFLDANENPLQQDHMPPAVNRYPDSHNQLLRSKMAAARGLSPRQVFAASGSDEVIDLMIRAVCQPGSDSIIIFPPTYGMYQVAAAINQVGVVESPLTADFQLDETDWKEKAGSQVKIAFVCHPNNPTGNTQARESIESLLSGFDGLVVVDEAYIDFCPEHSCVPLLAKYPNLVVMQTLSKAYGLAGARVGFAFGDATLIGVLQKIKPPYNISGPSARLALLAIENSSWVRREASNINDRRQWLKRQLGEIPGVKKIFPSQTNFLLVQVDDASRTYTGLLERGVVVRDRSKLRGCESCLRVTVGTEAENLQLVAAWRELAGMAHTQPSYDWEAVFGKQAGARKAFIQRYTAETRIDLTLDLDQQLSLPIETGIGFFDHMLEQIARHGGISLGVSCRGDLHVDEHHTVEDVGIALGQALKQALGKKANINRYGFVLPMDESYAQVLVDLSGRAHLQWDVAFAMERIGQLPTELISHFFGTLASNMEATIHVKAEGVNEHHKCEAVFKAFARALGQAVRMDERNPGMPSTKGML